MKRSNLKSKAKKAPKAHAHFADCSFRLRSAFFFLRAELQNQEMCWQAGERHIRSLRAERKGYQCDNWATPVSLCSEIADFSLFSPAARSFSFVGRLFWRLGC